MFYSNFERKNYKALAFNIAHFVHIAQLLSPSNKHRS